MKEADKKVDVMIDDMLITSYCWPGNVMKPVLYPAMTSVFRYQMIINFLTDLTNSEINGYANDFAEKY